MIVRERSSVAPRGALRVEVDGGPVYVVHNLVVLAGRNLIRDFLAGLAPSGLSRFAVGTGTTAAAAGDTALGNEVFRDTFTQVTSSDGQLIVKYYLASGSANGYTLSEAGLFGGSATSTPGSGTLYARATYPGVAKTASQAITYTWTLTWEV